MVWLSFSQQCKIILQLLGHTLNSSFDDGRADESDEAVVGAVPSVVSSDDSTR